MAAFDFSGPPLDRDCPARSGFMHQVCLARQFVYDLSESTPNPRDTVVRHKDAESDWDRQQAALRFGLVHLVAQLDKTMCGVFRELWESRRDLLEGWVGDHFGAESGGMEAFEETEERTPKSRARRERRKVNLPLSFSDVWAPSTRHMTLEDYVRDKVFARWDGIRPKRKIKTLSKLLTATPPPSEDLLDRLGAGLEVRNEFVHPRPYDMPPVTKGLIKRPWTLVETSQTFRVEHFDRFADACVEFSVWLAEAVRALCSGWIATDIKRIRRFLSDSQAVALGCFRRNTGEFFKSLEDLLSEINKSFLTDPPAPSVLILQVNEMLLSKLSDIDAVKAAHPELPVILFVQDHARSILEQWNALLASRTPPATAAKQKREPKESQPPGLQRLPGFYVVHDTPWVFDDQGRHLLESEPDARGIRRRRARRDGKFDQVDVLQRAIDDVVRPPGANT